MEASLENANNPFGIQNGAAADANIMSQKNDGLLLNLTDNFKQNGSDLSPTHGFFEVDKPNSKRPAPGEFDDDDDFGPETNIDALDDLPSPSPTAAAAAIGRFDDVLDEGVYNPFVEHQEKAALEMERHLKQRDEEEEEEARMAREEAPTPPADAVHDVSGLVDNAAESDSEDEWNYIKGEEANKENEPLQPETKVAEIPEEDDNMSQLNPNAAEFVPVSPTRSIPSPSARRLMNDPVIAQSPKRPVKFDINLPNASDFEREVKSRPSDVDSYSNGHKNDDDRSTPTDLMESILNGRNIDDIPEFQPGSTPKKGTANEEFHFGPNAAPFTPIKSLDQSEAALSTRALFGDESVATLGTSYNESIVTPDEIADANLLNKESDPMSMSFYADKGESTPFDLNKVHVLPDNLDEFLLRPDREASLDDTMSDLPEHDPLDNDDAIRTTDLDKQAYDDEKELASPLEADLSDAENETESVQIHREPETEEDLGIGIEEPDFATTPEPTHENLLGAEFCRADAKSDVPESFSLPPDVELITPEAEPEVDLLTPEPKPEIAMTDLELLAPQVGPEVDLLIPEPKPEMATPDVELLAPQVEPDVGVVTPEPKPEIASADVELSAAQLGPEVDPLIPEPKPEMATTDAELSAPQSGPEVDILAAETGPETSENVMATDVELLAPQLGPEDDASAAKTEPETSEKEGVLPPDVELISAAPTATEVVDLLGLPEALERAPSPDFTAPDLLVAAQERFQELCRPDADAGSLPTPEAEIEADFAADQSTLILGASSPADSVATADVDSFLNRSLPPDVASPLSPEDKPMSQQELAEYLSHPLSKCVFPLPPQFRADVEVPSVTAPEPVPSAPPAESTALGVEPTALGVSSAVALGAAVAAVATVVAAPEEEKKKSSAGQKKPSAAKGGAPAPAFKLSTKTTAAATAKTSASRAGVSPKVAPAKPGLTKTATTTSASKTAAPKPIAKPKATLATKSAEKKPLANGDIKSTVRSTLTVKKAPSETTTALKTSTSARLASATSKLSPTKPPSPKPSAASRPTAPRPAPRPATTTTTGASAPRTSRPTTLTGRPLTATSPTKSTTASARAPISKTAAAAPRPKPLANPAPLKAKPLTSRTTVTKAADAEKQNKESANKITAARNVTSRTYTSASARTTATTVRKIESKTSSTRTTASKTTTITAKSTAGKKPIEIVKTKTTKIEKPKQNGTSATVIESIVIDAESSSSLLKDNSPIDNKLIAAASDLVRVDAD